MKQPPYNTGKVLIGCYYDGLKPCRSHMTPEGEFWQSVLLGDFAERKRYKVQVVLNVAILVGAFALMGWLA